MSPNRKATLNDPRDAIIKHLEENGIMRNFVAKNIGITPGHFTQILNKERELTEKNRQKINELWGTNY